MSSHRPTDQLITKRFVLREVLGRGGMGVVYRAYDRDRDMEVALKTLRRFDAIALYRFKREFRALADVAHPNLVSLYELVSEGEQWFFTMELLHGVNFLDHVRGYERTGEAHDAAAITGSSGSRLYAATPGLALETATIPGATATLATREISSQEPITEETDQPPPPLDAARLRAALRQLASGLHALHNSGHLHCDIKPSNVIVTNDGRVVLLDFGVATELAGREEEDGFAGVVGTPAYMAPEQATATQRSPASDWYGVGVMMYEALAGRRPFTGTAEEVLAKKRKAAVSPPSVHRAEVPTDLEALCLELLHVAAEERPEGTAILARLGVRARPRLDTPAATITGAEQAEEVALVGRNQSLAELREAFEETQRGAGVTIHVHAESGMGKTAMVRSFLDELSHARGAVVLAGRCYERESVPYKAVDSLVDSLVRYLASMARHDADALMPRDVRMLARLFPVLRRVEAVAQARRRDVEAPDLHELRRRGFAALRELLGRIASQRPLVLFIDDAQWGDVDSAPLIDALTRPPDPPELLLLLAYRTQDAKRSALLKALFRRGSRLGEAANLRRMALEPLDPGQSRELAEAILGHAGAPLNAAEDIARESAGNPYFVHQLASFLCAEAGEHREVGRGLTLDQVIQARVAQLPGAARRVLEVLSVAGKPVAQSVVKQASRLDEQERAEQFQILRSAHWARLSGVREYDVIEVYHDRIRQTVLGGLEEERRRTHHRTLAYAIQASEHPDVEALVTHFQGAGEDDLASEYAVEAAHEAEQALAFDRAADLYQTALDLGKGNTDWRRTLQIKLGDALANAGRGADAAAAYLTAAEHTDSAHKLELHREAATQLLRSGHIDEGVDALKEVLAQVGFTMATTPRRALARLLYRRARLRIRGLGFRTKETAQIPPDELARIDVCWTASHGLGMVDTFRAADFQTRQVLHALRAGERERIVRALMLESCYVAIGGRRGWRRALVILDIASELVESVDDPAAPAWVAAGAGLTRYQGGRFAEARTFAEGAVHRLRTQCAGVSWELATVELYLLWTLYYLGEIRLMTERLESLLTDARDRGDLYQAANMRTGLPAVAWLAADEPETGAAELDEAMARWSRKDYHLQHYWELFARAQIDLYTGDAEAAHARIVEQ